MLVTKDTKIGEMLEFDREIAIILMQSGMHCVGCPSSINETLEEACIVHKLETTQLLTKINAYLENRIG